MFLLLSQTKRLKNLGNWQYHNFDALVICRMVFNKHNNPKALQIYSAYLIFTPIGSCLSNPN